jgi:hypothetical protein
MQKDILVNVPICSPSWLPDLCVFVCVCIYVYIYIYIYIYIYYTPITYMYRDIYMYICAGEW